MGLEAGTRRLEFELRTTQRPVLALPEAHHVNTAPLLLLLDITRCNVLREALPIPSILNPKPELPMAGISNSRVIQTYIMVFKGISSMVKFNGAYCRRNFS